MVVGMVLIQHSKSWINLGTNNQMSDPVNNPIHYTTHPSGIDCIQISEHFNFCLGNAIKYIWRAGQKGERLEDLEKARWYIEREIKRVKKHE